MDSIVILGCGGSDETLIIMGNEAAPGEVQGKAPSTAAGGSQENEELCWESQTTTAATRAPALKWDSRGVLGAGAPARRGRCHSRSGKGS